LFTDGELNKLIDSFLHPFARENPCYWALDTLLHGIVEQDPEVTLGKFARYTLPKLFEQAEKRQKRQREAGYPY
jgi:hypothetical protein